MAPIAPQAAFSRLVTSLGPYRDDVIFVGGWAAQLYHYHPKAAPQSDKPLMTADADIYLQNRLLSHQPKIDARLKTAGFDERLDGDDDPPVSKYILSDSQGFYVEFLTEATGSGMHTDGSRHVTAGIEGVTAQKLDYLDLALLDPWEVGPILDPVFEWPTDYTVKIINPACYIAQKILIHPKRLFTSHGKGEKDLLYVYDAIVRFADQIEDLRATWQAMAMQQRLPSRPVPTVLLSKNAIKALQSQRVQYFETLNDRHLLAAELVRAAGRDDQPSAEAIRSTLQAGLRAIFSP